jgi:L-alanine-DL-glutamate epimerase-like enolase superfamily enzyme
MTGSRFGETAPSIERIDVSAYTVPTDSPESDGTYAWDKTTIVIVEASAGGKRGLGYTYADVATARLIQEMLAKVVTGRDAMAVPGCWLAMVEAIRNLGRPGIASMAIAAIDTALWDLKARLLDLPLVTLLGAVRECAPVYGSGGSAAGSPRAFRASR